MPSRQDLLSLQERVKQAMKTLAEMKRTPQPMAGDSWVYYRRMIAPAYDLELHGITSPSFVKLYKVTYVVDSAGINIRFNIFAPQRGTISVVEQ